MMPNLAPRAQQQPNVASKSRLITPASLKSAGSKRKASTFIASASKMLKPNNSKKMVNGMLRADSLSPGPLTIPKYDNPPSSQIPIKRKPFSPGIPQSLPARKSPPTADKPLPSLPVATIVTASPVQRRSLIDATELPLRRSITPQSGDEVEEDWPALSPERPVQQQDGEHRQYDPRLPRPVKPSIGESVINGISNLNLRDATPVQPADTEKEATVYEWSAEPKDKEDAAIITPTAADFPTPPSSSGVKPTGYRKQHQRSAPIIRQTKTSTMRMRLSTGSIEEPSQAPGKQANLAPHATSVRVGRTPVRHGDPIKPTVPIRSKSRLRHMATGRGSPYTIPSRGGSRSSEDVRNSKTPRNNTSASEGPRSVSGGSTGSNRASYVVAVKEARSAGSGKRKTSIPLPARLIRHYPNEESEAEIPMIKHRRASAITVEDPSDADVDTDNINGGVSSPKSPPILHRHATLPAQKQGSGGALSFAELMATPAPSEMEMNSDNHSTPSIHGHDENGSFKMKKLHGSNGAMLRVFHSAEALLTTGTDDEKKVRQRSQSRSRASMKDQLRKSSNLIKSQIRLTRSITERSLARGASPAEPQIKTTASDAVDDVPDDEGDLSVIVKREHSEDAQLDNTTTNNDFSETATSEENKGIGGGLPSSLSQGDWPLKDFQSLASASKDTSTRDSIDSSWIPPPDWETRKSPDLFISSPPPEVSHNTPVAARAPRNHFSSPSPSLRKKSQSSYEDDDIPPPTPEKDSIFKRKFPPRTTSKQYAQPTSATHNRNLSTVREMSEHSLRGASPMSRTHYKTFPNRIPQPSNPAAVIRALEDINKAARKSTPPSSKAKTLNTTSNKKPMSTIRNLFHKKSSDLRGSLRVKRSRPQPPHAAPAVATNDISSPLPPTPSPLLGDNNKFTRHLSRASHAAPIPSKATFTLGSELHQPPPVPPPAHMPVSVPASAPVKMITTPLLKPIVISEATQTAKKALAMAQKETDKEQQGQLATLGELTIEVINKAHDSEIALEQAKKALARTEMNALMCYRAVAEVEGLVEQLMG